MQENLTQEIVDLIMQTYGYESKDIAPKDGYLSLDEYTAANREQFAEVFSSIESMTDEQKQEVADKIEQYMEPLKEEFVQLVAIASDSEMPDQVNIELLKAKIQQSVEAELAKLEAESLGIGQIAMNAHDSLLSKAA